MANATHPMRLRTEEEIRILRENLEQYERARAIRDGIVRAADPWLERGDDFLRTFIPPAEVPRSFYVSFSGCPVHGKHHKGIRDHSWRYDPFEDPWKAICPIGGEAYPSNDFAAFLRSGMQDRSLLTGEFPDDGWGYRMPGVEFKYWFIGFCCQRLWGTILGGVTALSRAYVLTGEKDYAHKALVMLDRIAEVYPAMNYNTHSMYAEEASPGYTGKIMSLIPETGTVAHLCEAYDNVRPALEEDPAADRMREHLEEGIVRAGMQGVYDGDARGNYGGHQYALLVAAIASGDPGEIERAVDWVMNHTGEQTRLKEVWTFTDDFVFRDKAGHAEGLNFSLDNLLFREGIGWESAPSYNSGWIRRFMAIGEILDRLGINVFDRPKMRRMLYWPMEMDCLGKFSPAIGDTGSMLQSYISTSSDALRTGFERYGDPAFARILLDRGYYGEGSLGGYEELFRRPLDRADLERTAASFEPAPVSNTNMGGYGLVLLRSGEGERGTAVSVYYGRAGTEHGQFDRLSLEVFGYGRKLVPDLGYGEVAMEAKKPAAWTKNTVSHSTVVVDERRQDTQLPGQVRALVGMPGLQVLDVSAPHTYLPVSLYRREVALIDLSKEDRYVLDIFRVEGGDRHDYSIHGFDGTFSTEGIELSPPQEKGTLAGEDVAFGELYDEPNLDRPHKSQSYYVYRGSGYSYLYDVQRGRPEDVWSAVWKAQDDEVGVKLSFLPGSTEEAVVATGEPPLKDGIPDRLKYVLLRNAGERLSSTFGTVIEPFEGSPKIDRIDVLTGRCKEEPRFELVALRIRHKYGLDYLISSLDERAAWEIEEGIRFRGRFGRIRLNAVGEILRMDLVGCGHLSLGEGVLEIDAQFSGRISDVNYEDHLVEVIPDADCGELDANSLVGETLLIGNGRHRTSYPIREATRGTGRYILSLGEDTFRVGKAPVAHIDPDGGFLVTNTYLYLAGQGYYRGVRLVDEAHTVSFEIEDVKLVGHKENLRRAGRITVIDRVDLREFFEAGDVAYLYDFGPEDRCCVTPHASAVREA